MKAGVSKKSKNDETFVFFFFFASTSSIIRRIIGEDVSNHYVHQWLMGQLICRLGIVGCAIRNMSGL
ncbi:MAG TPA: hypothetical protein VFV58_14390 [Blastocatellia bacterium]|nr:hypothetical protein [Blastocatellia bacterium]